MDYKVCPNCGSEVKETLNMCPVCFSDLTDAKRVEYKPKEELEAPAPSRRSREEHEDEKPDKKEKRENKEKPLKAIKKPDTAKLKDGASSLITKARETLKANKKLRIGVIAGCALLILIILICAFSGGKAGKAEKYAENYVKEDLTDYGYEKVKVDGDVIAKAKGRDIFLVGVEANYREDGTKLSEYDIIGIYIDKDKNYRVIANETYSMLEKEDVDEEAQQKLDDTVEQLELMNAFDDQKS